MKIFASLDAKDRRMLLILLGGIALLLILLAVLTPRSDPDKNPVPDSYLTGRHGARAAYTLLQQSGYAIQRWEQPLSELAAHADPGTILILAEPNSYEDEDRASIRTILQKGGRILATGLRGGLLLPGNAVEPAKGISFAACEAQPEGLQPLAGTGPIWILPRAGWKLTNPAVQVAYTCANQPVVVEYPSEKGHIVWWANSTPLENSSITRGHNLELLLNSVGSPEGHRIYWDESLHGQAHTPWDYTSGPVWPLLLFGCIGLALLVILSYSRRRGPIRPLPASPRTTPIEFLDALGSLYRAAGATSTATQIAWDRFRSQTALLCGLRNHKPDARELAQAIERRFGSISISMEPDLVAAEEACSNDALKPREALAIVQSLRRHEQTLRAQTLRAASTIRISGNAT
ncbi:DUF4350 domain-containing protein [Acidicapsa ligni]|uniref:DUF4350 domain-containing protein n=1 Tax=Acidicapsa ligni TaxID=542300 RepID=UPI0021DF421F|nr:DUF4350 domain-containing protein [Acidicapsa ligni]